MSRLVIISPEGRILSDKPSPALSPESGIETTSDNLAKIAFEEATKQTNTLAVSNDGGNEA